MEKKDYDRGKRLAVRLTEDEKKALLGHAKADGLSISDYIKRTALKMIVLANRVEYTADLRRLNFEINKIGNNVNQIARQFNSARPVHPEFGTFREVMAQYFEKMAEAERLLKRMYAKLAGL